ncbi:MAG TPA: DUF5667 domain-containing protein [Dehalococcoidales bacterium]|nr:MAG: hypothetical protein A2Z05_03845 [Chloroflexi bacterium RBG_16_60_22]HJX14046.1 DUF5667 domain-containing protein [Dehalococcoidales bacterium]
MAKVNEFDNILDECLERLLRGEALGPCLADYPDHADALEPLLRTALDARDAAAIRPRPGFRDRARYQFQAAIRDTEVRGSRGFFGWQPRWVTAVAVVIALLVVGSGTVAAAGNSLPDGPLYPVKLATEAVQVALTPSAAGKAELYVKLADKRVDEIIKMADKGKVKQVEQATDRLNDQLVAMAGLAAPGGGPAAQLAVPAPAPVPAPTPAPVPEPVAEPEAEGPQILMKAPPPAEQLPEAVPAPVIEVPAAPGAEAPVAVTPGAPGRSDEAHEKAVGKERKKAAKADEQEILRELLSRHALDNEEALREVLARVPESLKPALRRALEVAGAGYEQALRNLD